MVNQTWAKGERMTCPYKVRPYLSAFLLLGSSCPTLPRGSDNMYCNRPRRDRFCPMKPGFHHFYLANPENCSAARRAWLKDQHPNKEDYHAYLEWKTEDEKGQETQRRTPTVDEYFDAIPHTNINNVKNIAKPTQMLS